MDAGRVWIAIIAVSVISYSGCVLPEGSMSVGPTAKPAAVNENPAQHAGDSSAARGEEGDESTSDPEIKRVQEFIARIDDMSARVDRSGARTHGFGSNPASSIENSGYRSDSHFESSDKISNTNVPDEQSSDNIGTSVLNKRSKNDPVEATVEADGTEVSEAVTESPVLVSVQARPVHARDADAATASNSPAAGADGVGSINTPTATTYATATLEQLIELWQNQPTDGSFRQQLDQRLLVVLGGKYEEARRPLEAVSDQQQQMAGRLIEMLIGIRESHGGNPEAEAKRVLNEVQALTATLIQVSEPEIVTLALTRAVRGFGQYEPFEPAEFATGRVSEFVVYCEMRNFASRETAEGWHESEFAMRTTIMNRIGDVILELNDDPIRDRCRSRRHDCFIPRLVRLPGTISPGEYVVKVTIIDKIGEKVTEKRTTFRIVAR